MSSSPSFLDHPDLETESSIVAEINITPLTDIFLVLLIIFMVTTTTLQQGSLDVQLPSSQQATGGAIASGVLVGLLASGEWEVDLKKVPAGNLQGLEEAIRASFEKTDSRTIILEGDRKAFLGAAVQVMDVAKKAGALNFAIATHLE